MTDRSLSRRSVLGAAVAATAAAATAGQSGLAFAGGSLADPNDPRSRTESVGDLSRIETLAPLALGESVRFFAGNALVPNGVTIGTSSVTGARGASPRNGTAATFNYLSASVDAPVGSRLTSVEFVIEGSPQTGRVALIRWTPDAAVGASYLVNQTIPAAVNGITVYAASFDTAPLIALATVDGLHTYEAFYTDNGAASSTFCNAIRVKYIPPPTGGLIPVSPARVYDSRLNMVPDANGPLATNSNRTVSVANARDVTTGAIVGALVPSNATAIAYTLTVANTLGQGFVAVNPGGVTTVSASTINWSAPGSLLANTGVVKIDSTRTVTAIGGGGGSTDFIIDIVGYYV